MAISVTWATQVINVPKEDMTLVQSSPVEIRELDVNTFRLSLKALESEAVDAGAGGMAFVDMHQHSPPVTVGGVTLARVVQIVNGYSITFADGQYAVNLAGANNNIADVTNVNQVSVRSSNSAGLVTSAAIEYGEYGAQVHINQALSTVGTVYPRGTLRDPVGNLADAKIIATSRGFGRIQLLGDFTFLDNDSLSGFEVVGQSANRTTITLSPDAVIEDCEFSEATIAGMLDGGNSLARCEIGTINYVDGSIRDCQLNAGTITIGGTLAYFINCWSGVAGGGVTQTPRISIGAGTDLIMRGYNGGISLLNKTGTDDVSIDMSSGHVVVDASCDAGVIVIRGISKITNNSSGTCEVNSTDCVVPRKIEEVWKVHGLDTASPLVVSPTQRTAGSDIQQTITDGSSSTTVQRD